MFDLGLRRGSGGERASRFRQRRTGASADAAHDASYRENSLPPPPPPPPLALVSVVPADETTIAAPNARSICAVCGSFRLITSA